MENQRASEYCQSTYWLRYLQRGHICIIFQINRLISDKTFPVKRDKYIGGKFGKDQVLVGRNVDDKKQINLFVISK